MEVHDDHGHWDLHVQGDQVIQTHGPDICRGGPPCCLHNPSEHHMKRWKLVFRQDRNWLGERICVHGVGHPDPDSLKSLNDRGIEDDGVHGCCPHRCCKKEST